MNASQLWGNIFLAKRTAEVLVKIGIVATVTVGGMDAVVEPSGTSLWRVTGETMTMNTAQLTTKLSCFGAIAFWLNKQQKF
jgi:O-antigen ligase